MVEKTSPAVAPGFHPLHENPPGACDAGITRVPMCHMETRKPYLYQPKNRSPPGQRFHPLQLPWQADCF